MHAWTDVYVWESTLLEKNKQNDFNSHVSFSDKQLKIQLKPAQARKGTNLLWQLASSGEGLAPLTARFRTHTM